MRGVQCVHCSAVDDQADRLFPDDAEGDTKGCSYQKMVEVYGADNITLLGFSSGAALAISICLYNNTLEFPLPVPHRIIACSPGCCSDSEAQLKKMKELNAKDIMVDTAFI